MPTTARQTGSVHVYGLDQNRIKRGDILLSRVPLKLSDKKTWESFAIQKATSSPFSHAALCTQYGHFIEAIGPGVCRLAIGATAARSKNNIRLLRLKEDAVENALERAQLAAQRGELFLTRGYSVPGAFGVKLSLLRNAKRNGLFCSQLVARAYSEAGIQLVAGKAPEIVAPGDLANSPFLCDVTNEAILEIVTDQGPPFYLDDGSPIERPHHWEIITKLLILGSQPVQRELTRLGKNAPSFFELEEVLKQTRDPKLDAAIFTALKKRRFAEQYLERIRRETNPNLVNDALNDVLQRIQNGLVDNREIRTIIWLDANIDELLKEDVDHRRREFDDYMRWHQEHGLHTFGYLGTLQNRLLALSVDCLNAIRRRLNILIPESQRRGMKPGPPGTIDD